MFNDSPSQTIKSRHLPSKNMMLLYGGILIIVLFALAAGFFFWKYTQLKKIPPAASNSSGVANATAETTNRLVREVGMIYQLPADDQPTIARVGDITKLAGQPFFKDAQSGDYVLVYTKAQLGILYRESVNKIINAGPIAVKSSDSSTSAATTQPKH